MSKIMKLPGGVNCIVDSFVEATGTAKVGARTFYWDFSDMFGPLFTTAEGEPLKNQPGPRSRAWKTFEEWHKELKEERNLAMAGRREGIL
jgi:hypothetical protein